MCVDPSLCRGTRRVNMGRGPEILCVGETVGKVGEVDEMGERACACVSVSGAAKNET